MRQAIRSTAAIKFETASTMKSSSKASDDTVCKPISVFMEVVSMYPEITLDKTSLNFWECRLYERKYITIRITNKNDELPLDFRFTKVI